jgi:hypothetical protein
VSDWKELQKAAKAKVIKVAIKLGAKDAIGSSLLMAWTNARFAVETLSPRKRGWTN